MITESRLTLEEFRDIHPALIELGARFSGKINLDYILAGMSERVALDLVHEKTDEKRYAGPAAQSARISRGGVIIPAVTSQPGFEDVYRYMVYLCHEKPGNKITKILGLEIAEPGNNNETNAVLDEMAKDLKRVYGLNYNPHIYKNGRKSLR